MKQRSADPYRDLDVIDARAPRVMQGTIGVLALVAFLTGWWPLLAVLAAQLALGLTFGRRWCVPCLFYFEVIQPRFQVGHIDVTELVELSRFGFIRDLRRGDT